MSRKKVAVELVPVEFVKECFALRQDGQIVRREHRIAALAGAPATFAGPGGKLLVRLTHNGGIRRIPAGLPEARRRFTKPSTSA